MSKLPTRRFASRMSGLRIVVACLLTLVAPTTLPADESSPTESPRAEVKAEAAPRRRIEVSVQLVELDKSLIGDDESKLWKLVPWTKITERYGSGGWSGFYEVPQVWHVQGPKVDPSHYRSLSDEIRGQVQAGKALMSFTIPQDDSVRFVTDAVTHKQGRLVQESTNVAAEGSPASFRLAHHPLAVRQGTFALRPHSRINRNFSVAPRSYRAGIQLVVSSAVEVTTPFQTGWPWLDNKVPPSRQMLSGSARITELVPRGQALVVFSLGSGDDDMEPGRPSLLVIVPKEIDAVAMPDPAVKIEDAAAQPAQPAERLGYGSPVAPPTGVSPATEATPTNQPDPEAAPRRVVPAFATETQSGRPRRRDRPELKALHDDVRALREDVRRLSELLERRLAVKDMPQDAHGASDAVSQTDTRGKFEATVQPNVLLNFTATWCGPCQKMQPMINKLVRDGCSIQTVDIDRDAALAKRFNVKSIPCFIRLSDGKEIDRLVGLTSESELRRLAPRISRIQEGLQKRVSLHFDNTRLVYVVKRLAELTDVNIAFDKPGLEEEGLTRMAEVSISVDNVRASSALNLILSPLNLATIEQDEVLLITSRIRTKGEPTVETYPVEDLFPLLDPEEKSTPERNERCLKRIGEIIRSTIEPDSWDAVGGRGSLRFYETTRSLIVRQTSDVHAEIARLLGQIRRLKRLPEAGGKGHEAVPSTERPKAVTPAIDGVLKLSAKGKRAKPVLLLVGQQGELQFAGRIRSVDGHDGAILQLSRVADESLLVQGASVGTTLLRVSIDGVAEPFDVVVVVSPFVVESNTTQIILRADDVQPQKVSLRVNHCLEVTVDDWLTRVDGFDPHLVDVKAVEKDRLRFTGSTAGTTTATLTTRSGKSHTVEVTVLAADAWKQHPLVRQRIAAREDLPRPIGVPLKGKQPIELDADVSRISIGSADAIDIVQMDPRHVVVIGKQAGLTRLTFWFEKTAEPLELFVLVPPLPAEETPGERTSRKDRNPNYLLPQLYPVFDLVVPVSGEASGKSSPKTNDQLRLINLITTTVEPENWKANGGPCSIKVTGWTRFQTLDIRATPKMHKAIAELVNAMGADRGIQVVLETRLLQTADDSVLEKAGLKDEFDPHTRTARLDERGARRLVETVEAEHGETLIVPKLTFSSGWSAHVGSEVRGQDDQMHGIQLYVRGLVAKDHKCVRLGVAVNDMRSLYNEPSGWSHTLNDGGYLLLDMTDQCQLAKSYLAKSMKPKGRVLLLVQPRIVIPEKKDVNKVIEDGVSFGGVQSRIIIQEKEAKLLGVPAKEGAVRTVPEM